MRECPCGSTAAFVDCCERFLRATALPETPEQLMRSRYTAFAVGDADYLRQTWHPGTCPDDLDLEPDLTWCGLEILDAPPAEPAAKRGVIEFRAHWRSGRERGDLHERSRFVHQSGRWWYLDGVVA